MFVEAIVKQKYEEQIKKLMEKQDNEIWVSELVQCKQKSTFAKQFYFLFTIEPRLILGEIVHRGFLEWLKEEFGYNIEVEVKTEFEGYVISGRVDAMNSDEVIEVKYAADVKDNQPYEHHVQQLRIYMWITQAKRGKLLYITPQRILEFEVTTPMRDDEVLMLIDNWKSPRYEWECKYCSFSRICSQARNGGR